VAQRSRSETQLNFGARRSPTPSRSGDLGRDQSAAESTNDFRARAARLSGIQAAFRMPSDVSAFPEEGPAVEQLTLLAPWCQITGRTPPTVAPHHRGGRGNRPSRYSQLANNRYQKGVK
jgi:hypothetical protein